MTIPALHRTVRASGYVTGTTYPSLSGVKWLTLQGAVDANAKQLDIENITSIYRALYPPVAAELLDERAPP
jgi:hypothetical protein